MKKSLLIVGIDPGTTLGYAAIDFEGNVIKVYSKKDFDISSLISDLINLGKPLIIASDKEHNPDFVDKLATKLGARIITPDYDLKIMEKRQLVREHETKNQHELDALASALFAFKRLSPKLKKINIFVEHYQKEQIKDELIEFVVGKDISIKDAIEIIEEPETKETKIIRDVVEEKKLSEKDFIRLYKELKEAKRSIELLRKQNKKLKDKIAIIKRDYEYVLRQINKSQINRKTQALLQFKEKRIRILDKKLKKKQEEIESMKNEVTTLLYFLANMNSSVLLKKLDNLGITEFEKKRTLLNIQEGDILLVKDPDIISKKTIEKIKGKIHVIFYKKQISRKLESSLPFVFIDINELPIEENKYFGIISKSDFEKVKNKKKFLEKILEDYKKERLSQSE